jgi:hypothetical protein
MTVLFIYQNICFVVVLLYRLQLKWDAKKSCRVIALVRTNY